MQRSQVQFSTSSKSHGFTILELIVVIAVIGMMIALLLPAVRTARPAARRSACMNHLKQIGIALHNYHDTYGGFPPAYLTNANGKPLHSWRVLILPFLDQVPLYEKIDLTKPWNDPVNAEVAQSLPQVYACPSLEAYGDNQKTVYQAVIGPDSYLVPTESRVLEENEDNAKTLIVVEVAEEFATHWMSPELVSESNFLRFDEETEYQHETGTHGLTVDGRVQFFYPELEAGMREDLLRYQEADSSDSAPATSSD
ncbi:MAG: DUF1559 domain-containing protein [Planctomycetaceae bacterium]|nr:DUF1559 domain-containing protein [Planctomycetaceae bacterium]